MIAALCLILPFENGCKDYVQDVTTPHALFAESTETAPRRLRLAGEAQRVEHRISRAGHPYDIVFLCEGECIRVFYPDRSAVENGDRISAVGTYYPRRKKGRAIYHREMDAAELFIER